MTGFLPPHLLAYFTTQEIPFAPPMDKLRHEKVFKRSIYSGVGDYMKEFLTSEDTTASSAKTESAQEIKQRIKKEREEQRAYRMEQNIATWDPKSRRNTTQDPFKTLFVGRLNYDTKESKLKREFEIYGQIKEICMIQNSLNGKPRGYAFIEYEREKDMARALKRAGGTKIDGHRVLVDIERGRTVDNWLPRKFGGGLGGRKDETVKNNEDLEDDRCRERRTRHSERSSRSRSRRRSRSRSKDKRRRHGSRSRQVSKKHKRRSLRSPR